MSMLAPPETTGADVRSWRRIYGLSMKQLAERLGVHWLTVQHWEIGRYPVPPYLYLALRELARQLLEEQADDAA